ncbi:GRAS transcription factor [Trema orientale]|uniref:GRAS transcription factor n=1 Tax=Trema orientale TaxID=63057 RepID=A0A2P5F978_TREOI|nr:GRAS transcription factor [Trema orientale]
MMQPELFEPSWPFYDVIGSTGNQSEYCSLSSMDSQVGGCEFSSLFTTIDCQSEISSNPFSSAISGESVQFAASYNTLQVMSMMEDLPMDLEVFEPELSGEFEAIYGCLEESVGSFPSQKFSVDESDLWSPSSSTKSEASMDVTSVQPILSLPGVDMEIDNELSVFHLLKAIGEAMEKGQRELEEVILRCISEKVSPLGKSLERLAFNLCQQVDTQCVDYLKQESLKNSEAAFKAFSQILPYVKFAHFTANSAILEATPDDIETVHIVDFDMGEGLQWSEMIAAAAMRKKALKLTSIRWDEEKETDSDPLKWSFGETRRQLLDHARSFGLKLKVEEMGIEDLVSEVKKAKKRGGGREFLAFNCMVGIPHMRSVRSRRLVMEFLEVAKDLLAANSANCRTSRRGIIVLADGDPCEKLKNCSSFSHFFDGHLVHYQALLESMESTFPDRLAGARMTMECLFVAPYISSLAWSQKWEEIKEGFHLKTGFGFEGWSLSKESIVEAKIMVGEDSCYEVRIEGQNGNEAALEWRGVPLVRVSAWTSQI